MAESELKERIEQLLKAANDAAQYVQNVTLTFLLFGTYIAIIIGSTTDEQLFKVSPVTLPLLNVGLPILQFYALIPWMFWLLHFNLLLQLYLLACNLHPLDAALTALESPTAQRQHRQRLYPFPFSHMLIGHHHGRMARFLLSFVVVVIVIVLPLVLLVWAQIRFLPYHDEVITWGHRGAVLLDLTLLWIFWPMTVGPGGSAWEWWRRFVIRPLLLVPVRLRKRLSAQSRLQPKIKALGKGIRTHRASLDRARGAFVLTWCITPVAVLLSLIIAVFPGEHMEQWIANSLASLAPQNWIVKDTEELKQDRDDDIPHLRLTHWLFDEHDLLSLFPHRNLRLREKILVAGEPSAKVIAGLRSKDEKEQQDALKEIAELSLTPERNLRFADLTAAVLPKADLRKVNLQGAHLEGADLQGAVLEGAQLQGADLREANLQGANLGYAQLQGAVLVFAELQGADLGEAKLQGANLGKAQLQGANLQVTELQDAYLGGARLQGADLGGARLQDADLGEAKLQGAFLGGARLQGADLGFAQLQGAVLGFAELQGANLGGARLQGADLREANLQGADLRGAKIGSASFTTANLSLSDLRQLNRDVLSQKDYDELQAFLSKAIRDETRRTRVLQAIEEAVGRPDDLERVSANTVLCDKGLAASSEPIFTRTKSPHGALNLAPYRVRICLPESKLMDYDATLAPYLRELGCHDPDIARGLVNRALQEAINEPSRKLGKDLARALLAPDCTGGAALPDNSKQQLQAVINEPQTSQ